MGAVRPFLWDIDAVTSTTAVIGISGQRARGWVGGPSGLAPRSLVKFDSLTIKEWTNGTLHVT